MQAGLDRSLDIPRLTFFRGRVALYTALRAMGVRAGDEIILPGYTCIVVPNAVIYLGAKPVFVDINRQSFNLDAALVEARITPRTRAIIAQHTYGIPADMDRIMDVARRNRLYVIEDCCHAIGSTFKGREVGTFGDIAFFSSQWSKPFTTGLGGWAVVNNHDLLPAMRQIHDSLAKPAPMEVLQLRIQYFAYDKLLTPSLFWFAQDAYRLLTRSGLSIGSAHPSETEGRLPPRYAMQMSDWQEKKLGDQLAMLSETIAHRKMITRIYEEGLQACGLEAIQYPDDVDPVFVRYPIRVRDKVAALESARKARVELGDWFLSPVHPNRDRWDVAGYQRGSCPVAEDVCAHVVNLPTHTRIDANEAARTLDFIKAFF